MNPNQELHDLGQSLWIDNITRTMLDDGTLARYIDELAVTGLTSNPTIFDKAIGSGDAYDHGVAELADSGVEGEELFFKLAIQDLSRAAELFTPIYERTHGVDGFVSLEVSPKLADDTEATSKQAQDLHAQAATDNVFIKIPGTPAGLGSIEATIYAGIPVNVTLLFSAEQYLAAADAYMKGVERRVAEGLDPKVPSVASLFISRWDVALGDDAGEELRNKLGIAISGRAYRAYLELLDSARWQRLANEGAQPQRMLWASTGTKDPDASDVLYVEALAAPFTINTMPENTLNFFADHGKVGEPMERGAETAEQTLAEMKDAGVDVDALAERLQREGAETFVKSWNEMLESIKSKSASLATTG
jgi:transaldolase